MRALKITMVALLTTLLLVMAAAAAMTWLVRSEQGSRWLLQQGLAFAPIPIELHGISGTLAQGLDVDEFYLALPLVELRASGISFSWAPASLLAGIVDIDQAEIAELNIELVNTGEEDAEQEEPDPDRLFWLQIPLQIAIASGQLGKLRIDAAEFEDIRVVGSIGRGRLDVDSLQAHIAGVDLKVHGELAGPAPGSLIADARWQMPTQNLSGSGVFDGDIEELDFTHVAKVPETVNFNGTIYELFESPRLEGVADWPRLRAPLENAIYADAGRVSVSSDFTSARIDGNSKILVEGWPEALVQLHALIDLEAMTIDSYAIDVLDGHIRGSGRIDYAAGLQGRLAINGTQINTALLHDELPAQLEFASELRIESADAFTLDVISADARIRELDLSGRGNVSWQGGQPAAVDASVDAGTNSLSAKIELGTSLSGSIRFDAPELAVLWPGLDGSLDAVLSLSGSVEQPRARLEANAASLAFGAQSLQQLTLTAEFLDNDRLAGDLSATGLVAGQHQLGDLDFSVNGMLADHRSRLTLEGGVVAVQLASTGGWDGEGLSQRFDLGLITPDGFESWQLQQTPELRANAAGGQLGEHCWQQRQSSICVAASQWDALGVQTAIQIKDFALASLQPLLQEGYSIDGMANAEITLGRDAAGHIAELRWRQSRTVLAYSDNIDTFETVLDEVSFDLQSDPAQTELAARLRGEQGMNLTANAKVSGPLVPDSPLNAKLTGNLPSIELFRPLVHRVVNPGELKGKLTVDLVAAGTFGDRRFTGGAHLVDGSLGLLDAGITLSDINISAQSQGTDKLLVTGSLRSGDGTASVKGDVHTTEVPGRVEALIRVQGQNLATLRIPELSADTSPDLTLRIGDDLFDISGTIVIPSAAAQIRDLPQNAMRRSADVIVHAPEREVEQPGGTIVTGRVVVILGDEVRFNGFGLTSRLDGRLELSQRKSSDLRTGGTVRVREGFLTGYGRELRVDRGELTFTGPLDDPLINIQVSRESIYEGRQYIIGLRLTGSAQNVRTEPFSRPAMSERDVLSMLLTDRPATSDSDASGAALALGLQQLVPGDQGVLGLDEVSFETNDANQAAMVAGKRINDRLFVRYVFGSQGEPGSFRIRYQLGRGFSLEASTGSRQSLDLIYMLER